MTNFDKFKADIAEMDVEMLASLLHRLTECGIEKMTCKYCPIKGSDCFTPDGIKTWLESEVKSEE